VFAVAKVGKPNLIKPSHMDIEIRSITRFHRYLHECENHFGHLAKMERTVVVLRPIVVKTMGLAEILE
jgi:hypothetical protein